MENNANEKIVVTKKTRKKISKKRKIALISLGVVLVFTIIMFVLQENELYKQYNKAVELVNQGNFEAAVEKFGMLDDYKDSDTLHEKYQNKIKYDKILKYIEDKDYDSALPMLIEMNMSNGYEDSYELQNEVEYKRAVELGKNGELDKAYLMFTEIPISYLDVSSRITELTQLRKMVGKWFCKEHQIDMTINAFVDEENASHLTVELKDRNGFLLGDETNSIKGENIILNEDRFVWDMFGTGIKYRALLKNSKIQFSKVNSNVEDEEAVIVSFARSLTSNSIDGDIDSEAKSGVSNNVDARVK